MKTAQNFNKISFIKKSQKYQTSSLIKHYKFIQIISLNFSINMKTIFKNLNFLINLNLNLNFTK